MMKLALPMLFTAALLAGGAAHAQHAIQTAGAAIVVPAQGEVTRANDEARAVFAIEEQDKDKAAAASRVNQKMRQGMEIVRREDPQAKLKTRGYYTYPVYADAQPQSPQRARPIVGWRVGQSLEVTTVNIAGLPRTVAAAQRVLALNGLSFGLSNETLRTLDQQRIAAAYRHLTERIAAIAQAMGRDVSEATVEAIELEGAGDPVRPLTSMARAASAAPAENAVEEPSFEPGETTLQMRIVGRVRFKP